MPLYKFYRIVPKDATQTDCYIGHTVQPLRKRFRAHWARRNEDGACKSSLLFQRYGKEGLEIVLIHELELPDKEYARREERRLYEEVKEQAVNKLRPWTSEEEKRTEENRLRRIRYHTTDEKNDPRRKEYREANKERQAELSKAWREANKEKLLADKKAYYEANKERASRLAKEKYARESALKYLRRLLEE
jgi:hypothetical protein